MKGAKYSTHHSTFGCPYSLQNLNKDSCLVDRLSNNSMTEESDWSYASKQKLAVVKAIKGTEKCVKMLNVILWNCISPILTAHNMGHFRVDPSLEAKCEA